MEVLYFVLFPFFGPEVAFFRFAQYAFILALIAFRVVALICRRLRLAPRVIAPALDERRVSPVPLTARSASWMAAAWRSMRRFSAVSFASASRRVLVTSTGIALYLQWSE